MATAPAAAVAVAVKPMPLVLLAAAVAAAAKAVKAAMGPVVALAAVLPSASGCMPWIAANSLATPSCQDWADSEDAVASAAPAARVAASDRVQPVTVIHLAAAAVALTVNGAVMAVAVDMAVLVAVAPVMV